MHQSFMLTILRWIDDNLDQDISVGDIVARSGYSNAQLHRIFKEQLGCSIGEYMAKKRMYKCAIALKYTNASIKQLSERYHYANPQAFSRYFKSLFCMSPSDYRQNTGMEFRDLFSWKHPHELIASGCQIDYIHLDMLELHGVSDSYFYPPEQAGQSHAPHRAALEHTFQLQVPRPVPEIYTLCKPVSKDSERVNFEYHVGLPTSMIPSGSLLSPLPSVNGDYLKFLFKPSTLLPFEMSSIVYWGFFSTNNIKRRDGYDIESFKFPSLSSGNNYEYSIYIPVVFDDKLIKLLLQLRS